MKLGMPKRIVSLTLAFLMMGMIVPVFGTPITARAEGAAKTITGLGTGTIADPVKGGGQWNYVYYGKYSGESVKYRVLDVDSSDFGSKETMLLDCDNILYMLKAGSSAKLLEDMNDQGFYNHSGVFTDAEKLAIALSKKEARSESDGAGEEGSFNQLKLVRIFALDPAEATNESYGYPDTLFHDAIRKKKYVKTGRTEDWWLRLEKNNNLKEKVDQKLFKVNTIGQITSGLIAEAEGVSPAFNVERSSILFSSLVENNTYKLTVIDPAMVLPTNIKCKTEGDIGEVSFSYPHTDNDKELSFSVVLLKKKYERGMTVRDTADFAYIPVDIAKESQQGSGKKINNNAVGTFKLPGNHGDFKYAYLVSEKIGGETETDYAGMPRFFDLDSDDHVHEWELEYVAKGDNNAKIKCSNCGEKYTVSITAIDREYGETPSVKIRKPDDLPDEIEVSDVIYRDRDGNDLDESEITETGEYTAAAIITIRNENGEEQIEEIANDFKIIPIVLLPSMVKLSEERYIYDGTEKTPEVTVTVKGKELSKDQYEVEYKNNVEPGIATVVVSSLNPNYTEKVTNSFRIVEKSVADKEDKIKDKVDEKRDSKDSDKDSEDDILSRIEDKYKEATKQDSAATKGNTADSGQTYLVGSAKKHAVGDVINCLGATYIVTSEDDADLTVTYEGASSKTAGSVTIPSSIVVDGNEYRVTGIADSAFSGNKKLKKVTIGENVEKIGKNAFYGCSKLSKIKIESTYLKKKNVGKNAFKKINKKAKITVPSNKYKAYAKLLKARGVTGSAQQIVKQK